MVPGLSAIKWMIILTVIFILPIIFNENSLSADHRKLLDCSLKKRRDVGYTVSTRQNGKSGRDTVDLELFFTSKVVNVWADGLGFPPDHV